MTVVKQKTWKQLVKQLEEAIIKQGCTTLINFENPSRYNHFNLNLVLKKGSYSQFIEFEIPEYERWDKCPTLNLPCLEFFQDASLDLEHLMILQVCIAKSISTIYCITKRIRALPKFTKKAVTTITDEEYRGLLTYLIGYFEKETTIFEEIRSGGLST